MTLTLEEFCSRAQPKREDKKPARFLSFDIAIQRGENIERKTHRMINEHDIFLLKRQPNRREDKNRTQKMAKNKAAAAIE